MLTPKQTQFLAEYLIDLNGRQAAIRAGYTPKTAEVQASRLLRNAKVRVALEDAMQARSKRTEVSADRVIGELAKIAFSNPSENLGTADPIKRAEVTRNTRA